MTEEEYKECKENLLKYLQKNVADGISIGVTDFQEDGYDPHFLVFLFKRDGREYKFLIPISNLDSIQLALKSISESLKNDENLH